MATNSLRMNTSVNDCKQIEIPKILNEMGTLSVIEGQILPFEIKRVCQWHGQHGKIQNGCAYKEQQTFLVALHGSLDILLKDGSNQRTVALNRPNQGLFIPAGIWIEIQKFSLGAVCLTIASTEIDEQDCIDDYSQFKSSKNV